MTESTDTKLTVMTRDGHNADVHPDEVAHMMEYGWKPVDKPIHDRMIEFFQEQGLTSRPNVSDVVIGLNEIVTGDQVKSAWEAFKQGK